MDTIKNSWKQFVESATRLKARGFNRTFRYVISNIRLRFFLVFFIVLLFSYALVDFMTNLEIQSSGQVALNFYSPLDLGTLFGKFFLHNLRAANASIKLYVISLFMIVAYGLSITATLPLELIHTKRKFFMSNTAHELNTPLSILRASAEIVQKQGQHLSPKEMNQFATSMIEEVDRMSEIIQFFLHFSSPVKNSQLQMSTVNMLSVIKKVVRVLSYSAMERGVTFKISEKESGIIWGNFSAIEEMCMNLARNAIRHSPKGGVVRFSLKNLNNHVDLIVSDEGSGISKTDLPYIFDPFYKGENSVHGGHGLGLSIVDKIVRIHFGSISVSGNKPKGAVFTVKLPK